MRKKENSWLVVTSYLNSVQWSLLCCLWNEIMLNNEFASRVMIGDDRVVVESLQMP